jgi:hypothetical protein
LNRNVKKSRKENESYKCPFCDMVFIDDRRLGVPISELNQEYRDHMRICHPVQDKDLETTRWRDGAFVRCEPQKPMTRVARTKNSHPPGHGLDKLTHIDGEPESKD